MELFKAFYKYNSQTVTDKIAWCRSSQCRHFKYKLISDEAIKRQHLSAELCKDKRAQYYCWDSKESINF